MRKPRRLKQPTRNSWQWEISSVSRNSGGSQRAVLSKIRGIQLRGGFGNGVPAPPSGGAWVARYESMPQCHRPRGSFSYAKVRRVAAKKLASCQNGGSLGAARWNLGRLNPLAD